MAAFPRLRPAVRIVLPLVGALLLILGSATGAGATAPVAEASLEPWTGGVSLYRDGSFTTQQSWLWCTAADVQIARNIVYGERDHTASAQHRYFEWMRARNRYDLPLSAGVDPVGWTAGMREFVDDRYRLVASETFDAALRLAVRRIRETRLPVALAVSHGNHGWLLTGFTATADPAATDESRVSTVRVVGPLYGLQSRNGYDMRPNTELTTAQLQRYFTSWRYTPMPMIWDGTYVSIQPVPVDPPPAEASPAEASPTAESEAASTALPTTLLSAADLPAASDPAGAGPIEAQSPAVASTPETTSASAPAMVLPVLAAVIALTVAAGMGLAWLRAARRR